MSKLTADTLEIPTRSKRKPRYFKKNAKSSSTGSAPPQEVPRTSQILRKLLEDNQEKNITVEKIINDLGPTSFESSLVVFSLPELLPFHLPGVGLIVAVPNAILSSQMIRGKEKMQLPAFLLKRSIPRKVLVAAVKAILPVLEKLEGKAKRGGQWVSHPLTRRVLGVFILILAGVIALPIPWTCTIAAMSTILIGLGMAERRATLVSLGVITGLGSIALVGAVFFGAITLLA